MLRSCAAILLLCLRTSVCAGDGADTAVRRAILPDGLRIEIFADDIGAVRQLAVANDGTVAAGSTSGEVHLLRDNNGDGTADTRVRLTGLGRPHGVAWHGDTLYVGETSRILKAENVLSNLSNERAIELGVVIDGFPTSSHHGMRNLAVDSDGMLVVGFGLPCNVCEPTNVLEGTLRRINPRTGEGETIARGVRNSVGFDWHPLTGELWFTEHGRDWLGDDLPSDELNRLRAEGLHFGFPYCHQGDLPDPEFGSQFPCEDFEPPALKTGAHVANMGIHFYRGNLPLFAGHAFVALRGSWNRSNKAGYAVRSISFSDDGTSVTAYSQFIGGWIRNEKALARPVDIAELPDGSLLVSDQLNSAVYRISPSDG